MTQIACSHADQVEVTTTDKHVCEECVKVGSRWVHLRMCLTCGKVGCCDSSPLRHATAHYTDTHHALMRSVQPGEAWVWCYVDEAMVGQIR